MTIRSALSATTALCSVALLAVPARADALPPKAPLMSIAPGATSTAAPLQIYDGNGQNVPFLRINPSSHAVTLLGDGGSTTYLLPGMLSPRSFAARLADTADVVDYGADPTGNAVDDAPAFRLAVATGKKVYAPTGDYNFLDMVALPNGGVMGGDGRDKTRIHLAATTFNLAALGGVQCGTAEPGCELDGLDFVVKLPSVTTRSALTPFPPAIYAQNAARFKLRDVRVEGAFDCLDARGNTGGAFISNFECGALNKGMQWDGALDFVHIDAYHFWEFGFSQDANLAAIYGDGNTTGAEIGRADGMLGTNWTLFEATLRFTANAAPSAGAAIIDGLQMDGDGANIVSLGGRQKVMGGYSSKSVGAGVPFLVNGGDLALYGFDYAGSTPFVPIQVPAGSLHWYGGRINCNFTGYSCGLVTGGLLAFHAIEAAPGGTWTVPYFAQTSGALQADGGYASVLGNGSTIFSWAGDNYFNKFNHFQLTGWTVSLPPTMTNGDYGAYNVAVKGGTIDKTTITNSNFLGGSVNSNNVVTGTTYASTGPMTQSWLLDDFYAPQTLPSGGTLPLQVGAGMVVVTNITNGDTAAFLVSGGRITLLSSTGGTFVAGNAPASGQIGLELVSNSAGYALVSNFGSTVQVNGGGIVRTRNTP